MRTDQLLSSRARIDMKTVESSCFMMKKEFVFYLCMKRAV